MKKYLFLLSLFIFSSFAFGQDKKIDQLELLYSQHHYQLVFNRANRLLNNPEYDYSMMPKFYKSMAIMQLAQDNKKYKKSKYNLNIASSLFKEVRDSRQGKAIFDAHRDEISALKTDLISWAEDAHLSKDENKAQLIAHLIEDLFSGVETIPVVDIHVDEIADKVDDKKLKGNRAAIINAAEKLLGTPYVYGGTTTSGFDCSGYTGYVFHQNNIDLPRRSEDQFNTAKKVKKESVQPGDLVFFSNGGNVNHVGIIYAKDKDGIYMIHASTSNGVIISEITNSSYWTPRIKGYGSFLK